MGHRGWPIGGPAPAGPSRPVHERAGSVTRLSDFWAKSPRYGGSAGEELTCHLAATLNAAIRIRDRIGDLEVVPERFWEWACLAALLHDAGKISDGFQAMVGNGPGPARPWGERHEVLSLGFTSALLATQ